MPPQEKYHALVSGESLKGPRVYGPEAIRKINGHLVFTVTVAGNAVDLPLINVGKDEPVWIAYADVLKSQELRQFAKAEMVERLTNELLDNPNIKAFVTPQSSKSETFVHAVVAEVSLNVGKQMPLIQLIGSEDELYTRNRAATGLVTECISVVSAAKGIKKYMGITQNDAELLRALGGEIVWIDDILTTGETRDKSFFLINRALGLPDTATHPTFVIGTESEWSQGYPKKFPGVNAIYHTPEFTHVLPPILEHQLA